MGKVIAGRLLGLNSRVIAVGKDIETLPDDPKLTKISVDVSEWDNLFEQIQQIGPVHGLVNNAGVAHIESFLETTQHGWDKYVQYLKNYNI